MQCTPVLVAGVQFPAKARGVCWSAATLVKLLPHNADCQEVGNICSPRGGSERMYITFTSTIRAHSSFGTQRRRHQKYKTYIGTSGFKIRRENYLDLDGVYQSMYIALVAIEEGRDLVTWLLLSVSILNFVLDWCKTPAPIPVSY